MNPEQVAGSLKAEGLPSPCCESIYQYVYLNKDNGGDIYKQLRRHRKKYRKRGNPYQKPGQNKDPRRKQRGIEGLEYSELIIFM